VVTAFNPSWRDEFPKIIAPHEVEQMKIDANATKAKTVPFLISVCPLLWNHAIYASMSTEFTSRNMPIDTAPNS
jgi:hypothetical protein